MQKVIHKLNWFYSLEIEQVDMYSKQSSFASDQYFAQALKRFAAIEKSHADGIANHIIRLGGTPTKLGRVIGEIAGKVTGSIPKFTSLENQLRFNVMLEKKAMEDYKKMIGEVGQEELLDILWSNLLDEDLHTAWMLNKLEELEKKSPVLV